MSIFVLVVIKGVKPSWSYFRFSSIFDFQYSAKINGQYLDLVIFRQTVCFFLVCGVGCPWDCPAAMAYKPKFTSGQHAGVLVTEQEIIEKEKLGFTRW